MKMKNMALAIMACFLIFISMSCICACDDADVTNTRDVNDIIVDEAIDDSMDVIDDGGSSAASIDVDDGGSSAASIDVDDGGSSADDSMDVIDDCAGSDASSIDVDDGDSIIKNVSNDVPKYNNEPISNVKDGGNSFGDVQKLINDLPAGSVLYLYKDYAMQKGESSISISKDITIDGNNHKLDADKKGTIFAINGGNVVLANLVLRNGNAPVNGGAINVQSAKSFKCDNVTFSDNFADDSGGAVYIESSTPSNFTNCYFKNNRVDDHTGGAICSKGILVFTKCYFTDNKAYDYGGAIYGESEITCTDCDFTGNNASRSYGGAIYSETLVNCTDCEFIKNFAYHCGTICAEKVIAINSIFEDNKGHGGGAIHTFGECTVKNCEFISNSASNKYPLEPTTSCFGGAIYSCGLLTACSCKFSYNVALNRGGAIYANDSLSLTGDNEFIANEANDFGGAIYSLGDVYVNWNEYSNSTFKSNRANSDSGGAVYSQNNVYVGNAIFDSNFAEDDGGAIFSKADVYVYWNGVGKAIFKYNRANTDDGGSIYSKGDVYVMNADFSYGYAHDGGAIFACGNTIIDSSIFNVNHVSHQGGAIYDKSGLSLRGRTSFAANEAGDSGGAIYTRKFDEDVYHATFRYNVAGDDGGAIYIDHENHETFTECDFEDNYAGDEGGAIYLDDGDSHLSLIRNNLVNNKAKSGYTVYNHGVYDDIKDNWHGSSSPNFDNQFKKHRTILKDLVITPSSYAKTRISW